MNVSSVKNLNGETFSAVQDTALTEVVQTNSSVWNDISVYQTNSGNYITAHQPISANEWNSVYDTVEANSGSWTGGGGTSLTGDAQGAVDEVYSNSAHWNDNYATVTANSASWGGTPLPMSAGDGIDIQIENDTLVISATGGASENNTFYIFPGTTTNKEVAENSGKDMRLYNSAYGTYLDYAGKKDYSNYSILNFKGVRGNDSNYRYLTNSEVIIYPSAESACTIHYTSNNTIFVNNEPANTAQTAYYDNEGNYIANTHNGLTALTQFIQTNSGDWGGGSGPTGDNNSILLYKHGENFGYLYENIYISGASDLYFRTISYNYTTPQEIVITNNGSEVGRVYWTQFSSDGSTTAYSGSVTGLPTNALLQFITGGNIGTCYMSANGMEIGIPYYSIMCPASTNAKFNVQGSNITGSIYGEGILTSFTGNLTDFTAKGNSHYGWNITAEYPGSNYNYDISAEFGGAGGSTVTSGDVLPLGPTGTGNTYVLAWNDYNGLFWDAR